MDGRGEHDGRWNGGAEEAQVEPNGGWNGKGEHERRASNGRWIAFSMAFIAVGKIVGASIKNDSVIKKKKGWSVGE